MAHDTIEPLAAGTELTAGAQGKPRYIIERVLSRGGFSITYVARDRRLGGTMVVKELACASVARRGRDRRSIEPTQAGLVAHPKLVAAAIHEARTLNSLRDPRIVRVTDVFRENGTAYVCMDEVTNSSPLTAAPLAERLSPDVGRRIERIADQLLGALEVVHRAGIVHGDVKPDNVLVRPDDSIVLIDFGAAHRPEAPATPGIGRVYTRGYAGPEVVGASTGAPIGPWSDIYAWGMVVWGLLIGHGAWAPTDARTRVRSDRYAEGAATLRSFGVPSRWAAVVAWTIDLDPAQRPQSIEQIRDALRASTLVPTDERAQALESFRADAAPPGLLPTVFDGAESPHPAHAGTHANGAMPPTVLEVTPHRRPVTPAAPTVIEPVPERVSALPVDLHPARPGVVPIDAVSLKECEGCAVLNRPTARYCYACGVPLNAPPTLSAAGHPVGLGRRLIAISLDLVIAILLLSFLSSMLADASGDYASAWAAHTETQALAAVALVVAFYGAYLSVYSWICIVAFGATPGLALVGLTVVNAHGMRPGWLEAAVRTAFAWVSTLAAGVGFLWVVVSLRQLAWHDLASGTRVVRRLKRTTRTT